MMEDQLHRTEQIFTDSMTSLNAFRNTVYKGRLHASAKVVDSLTDKITLQKKIIDLQQELHSVRTAVNTRPLVVARMDSALHELSLSVTNKTNHSLRNLRLILRMASDNGETGDVQNKLVSFSYNGLIIDFGLLRRNETRDKVINMSSADLSEPINLNYDVSWDQGSYSGTIVYDSNSPARTLRTKTYTSN